MGKKKCIFVIATLVVIVIVAIVIGSLQTRPTSIKEYDYQTVSNAEELVEELSKKLTLSTSDEAHEENSEVTLYSIFRKLENYAKQLGAGVYYGVISLSNKEMKILREFAKDNMLDFRANTYHTYTIPKSETIKGNKLKRDSHVWGLGYCKCNGGTLYVHINRQFVYYDSETGKLIAITNPVDFADDNYGDYDNVLWNNGEDYNRGMPYRLEMTTTGCYVYYEKENGAMIQKMQFGEVVHTWEGSQIENGDRMSDKPKIVAYGKNDTRFLVANHNLMYFRKNEDEIKLVSNNVNLKDVVLPTVTCRTLYYSTLNELHMLNIDTLEDTVIAEDLYSGPTVLEYASEEGMYYPIVYCSKDGRICLVGTVFENYINVN